MPCFVVGCLWLAGPRITLVVLWLTGWTYGLFHTAVWPLLGFCFMPYTTICYACVMKWNAGQFSLLPGLLLAAAVALDVLPGAAAKRRGKRGR